MDYNIKILYTVLCVLCGGPAVGSMSCIKVF